MTEIDVKMQVCTFCLDFHKQYMKGVPFKHARKEAVTTCRICEQVMCADCEASSQKELQGDRLARHGLTMCQGCIKDRRLTTCHKEYEEIADQEEAKFKSCIRKEIYKLTQMKRCR